MTLIIYAKILKKIEKVQPKMWIVDIDNQALY